MTFQDRCHGPGVGAGQGPGVVDGSEIMQISNITDLAISKFVHITHECMDSKKLIMRNHTESDA